MSNSILESMSKGFAVPPSFESEKVEQEENVVEHDVSMVDTGGDTGNGSSISRIAVPKRAKKIESLHSENGDWTNVCLRKSFVRFIKLVCSGLSYSYGEKVTYSQLLFDSVDFYLRKKRPEFYKELKEKNLV